MTRPRLRASVDRSGYWNANSSPQKATSLNSAKSTVTGAGGSASGAAGSAPGFRAGGASLNG
ncbi:hypothetical protein [Rhodovulum marinum]|uniref:hypothetical protein n=1 Tax=Rhodovulum marinum TaxID=320662 RepID=UPI0014050828|nr:hypothetical protein [Rhodovulum marinum]